MDLLTISRRLPGLAALGLASALGCSRAPKPLVLCAKASPSLAMAAEVAAVLLEEGGQPVKRVSPEAGAGAGCFNMVKLGAANATVEDAGTAWILGFKKAPLEDPEQTYERVKQESAAAWGAAWLAPLGFRRSFALFMRRGQMRQLRIRRISDLGDSPRKLRCGVESELFDRADGYKGLLRHYDMEFCSSVSQLHPDALFPALADGRVDVAGAFAEGPRRAGLGLTELEDDQAYFPRYPAAVVLSKSAVKRFPAAAAALSALSGRLKERDLARLAKEAASKRRPIRDIARDYLRDEGLLP